MKRAVTLKENHEFRRLYQKGASAVSGCMVVYCRKNKLGHNRLGITVSVKLGHAVVRNRIRRQLREIYRLHEAQFLPGWDIVVVARSRAVDAPYQKLERAYLSLADKLGLLRSAEEPASQAPRVEKP